MAKAWFNEPDPVMSGETDERIPAIAAGQADHDEVLDRVDLHDLKAVLCAEALNSAVIVVANNGETELLVLRVRPV